MTPPTAISLQHAHLQEKALDPDHGYATLGGHTRDMWRRGRDGHYVGDCDQYYAAASSRSIARKSRRFFLTLYPGMPGNDRRV